MWQRLTRSAPTLGQPVFGFIQAVTNRFRWGSFRWLIPRPAKTTTYAGVDGQRSPALDITQTWPKSDGERADQLGSWSERVYSRLARILRLGVNPEGFVLHNPTHDKFNDEGLKRFESGRDSELQLALILESLELLDEADAQAIRVRLAGNRDESEFSYSAVDPLDHDPAYGLAVIRFSTRLAWVAARESLGASPSQRRALGLIKFQALTAQVVAERLRLPVEVVKHWVREGDLF
jgi:hypothetical protein